MRLMTLSEMVEMLRVEARLSQNVAHGAHMDAAHKSRLARIQEELYLSSDWPHLHVDQVINVNTNQRYIAYPSQFEFAGIDRVFARPVAEPKAAWRLLTYGIDANHLDEVDFARGETKPDVVRWQHYVSPTAETLNSNMFEIWPVPDRTTSLRFEGRRKLFRLTDNADVSTLDGPLIVLYAAAEILASIKAEDTTLRIQAAKDRGRLLKMREVSNQSRKFSMSAGAAPKKLRG